MKSQEKNAENKLTAGFFKLTVFLIGSLQSAISNRQLAAGKTFRVNAGIVRRNSRKVEMFVLRKVFRKRGHLLMTLGATGRKAIQQSITSA